MANTAEAVLPPGIRASVRLFFKSADSGTPYSITFPLRERMPSALDLAGPPARVVERLCREFDEKVLLNGDFVFMTDAEIEDYLAGNAFPWEDEAPDDV